MSLTLYIYSFLFFICQLLYLFVCCCFYVLRERQYLDEQKRILLESDLVQNIVHDTV